MNQEVEEEMSDREAYRKISEMATNADEEHLTRMDIPVRRMAMKRFRYFSRISTLALCAVSPSFSAIRRTR